MEYHPDWRGPPAVGEERPMIFHDSKGRPCVQYVTRLSCSILFWEASGLGGFFLTSRSPKGGSPMPLADGHVFVGV